jgi:hypothetical protein
MSVTVMLDTTTIDDEESTDVEALPSLDDWLRVIWDLRPGVSSPRCTPDPLQPNCATHGGWVYALWGFGA